MTGGTTGSSNTTCVSLTTLSSQNNTIDLGSTKTINNVYVAFNNNAAYAGAGISFSTDKVTYNSSIAIGATQYQTVTQFFQQSLAASVTARFVRLTNTAGNNDSANDSFCQLAVGP